MMFYERASGSRMHAAYFRVGGVHQDLPEKLIDDIEAFCDPFLTVCDDIEGLLTDNRSSNSAMSTSASSLSPTPGRGVFPASWCAAQGPPGICVRRNRTMLCGVRFRHPGRQHGDCYDRYCIACEGMRQSVRIMKQCLAKLRLPDGQGPVAIRNSKIVPPPRAEMKRSMEATSSTHFKLHSRDIECRRGSVRGRGGTQGRVRRLPRPTALTGPTRRRVGRPADICQRSSVRRHGMNILPDSRRKRKTLGRSVAPACVRRKAALFERSAVASSLRSARGSSGLRSTPARPRERTAGPPDTPRQRRQATCRLCACLVPAPE